MTQADSTWKEMRFETLGPSLGAELARKAGLKDFIDQSPEGYDTRIENNGSNLSLGVRRRIALARALATDGMLVIIDEPTEALDAEGVRVVGEVLNELSKRGRTLLVFSHDAQALSSSPYYLDLNSKPTPKMIKRSDAPASITTPKAAAPSGGKKPKAAAKRTVS